MRGHVRQRGNKWVAVAYVEGRHRWLGTFDSRKGAQRKLTEAHAAADRGNFIEPTKQTVGEFLVEWLEARRAQLRPRTFGNYSRDIQGHLIPRIGGVKLARLEPSRINAVYADLLANGNRVTGKGLSARAVQHVHVVLGRACEDAVKWGRLSRNPVRLADAPKPQRRDMDTWSQEELIEFLTWCKENDHIYRCARHYAAFLLAATTGMRRGEVLGLRWRDADLTKGKLTVSQSLVGNRSDVQFMPPKTQAGLRTIALDPSSVTALKTHRLATTSKELVFCEEDGRPLNPNAFSHNFDSAVRLAGMRRIRFHDLRHTYATLALRAGVNPKTVQERLGHSNVAITLGIYTHVTERDHQEAADAVAALIFGG